MPGESRRDPGQKARARAARRRARPGPLAWPWARAAIAVIAVVAIVANIASMTIIALEGGVRQLGGTSSPLAPLCPELDAAAEKRPQTRGKP